MVTAFQQYKDALDRLRRLRRLAQDTGDRQSAIYEEQALLWNAMNDPQRSEIRNLSWRAWPAQYDAQQQKAGLMKVIAARNRSTATPKCEECGALLLVAMGGGSTDDGRYQLCGGGFASRYRDVHGGKYNYEKSAAAQPSTCFFCGRGRPLQLHRLGC